MSSKQPPMPGLHTREDDSPPQLPNPTIEETQPDIRTALFGCPHHDIPGKRRRRNLIVNIDGTSNQFSVNSTNVVELFSRIIKSGGDVEQLVYHNSGIGTYARPSFRSWSYWKQVIYNHIDTAIAWNFESIVHAAYKWLSENYEPGDRIFLFGFSRGAYQVRVIAGMIEKVGLLHKGNENQIAFAYELYTAVTHAARGSNSASTPPNSTNDPNDPATSDPTTNANQPQAHSPESQEDKLCRSFKRSLCHEDVKVHFVGAWDTVSSIGVFRGKSFPETVSGMGHVCHFRHALALDERRAKFQPEYVNGGLGPLAGEPRGDVKEVWFKGTHSDIGGGNIKNEDLNNFSDSLRWMTYEAQACGLLIKPYTGNWVAVTPKESLTWVWMLLEFLPFGALAYIDKDSLTWWPHLGRPRKIQPGQLIHQSVFSTLLKSSETPQPTENEATSETTPSSPVTYCPKALLPSSLDVSEWTALFSQYSPMANLPIIEPDPFENASHILSSLSQACDALNSGQGDRGSALNSLIASIQTLQSFLDDATRLSSLFEVRGVDDILMKTIIVLVLDTTIKLRRESKETLIQLLARAWPVSKEIPTPTVLVPRAPLSQVYRWGLEFQRTHRDNFLKVLQPFGHFESPSRYVTFSGVDPARVMFTTERTVSRGGDRLICGFAWDGSIQPAKELAQCYGERSIISRDGSHIAAFQQAHITVINVTAEPPSIFKATDIEERMDGNDITSLCFSDDHEILASGHKIGWIKLWRREEDRWRVFKRFRGGNSSISFLAFLRDGSRLVFNAPPVKVWSLVDDALIELEDSHGSCSLAWSPSGDRVVIGTQDGRVRIWNPNSGRGKIEHSFKAHDEVIRSVAFRDDGQALATASSDHKVRVWRCETWEKVWDFDVGESAYSVAFSPDGKRLVSVGWIGALHLWDVET